MSNRIYSFLSLGLLSCCLFSPLTVFAHQANPWYFDLDCEHFKIVRDKSNDHIDVYHYNLSTKNYDWFQNLSLYAQKFDYHSEGPGLHFISVADESGHMLVYKWRNGIFYVWG